MIDHLRSVEDARVAAVIRDQPSRGRAARKVSLRASDGGVDVSAIARKLRTIPAKPPANGGSAYRVSARLSSMGYVSTRPKR